MEEEVVNQQQVQVEPKKSKKVLIIIISIIVILIIAFFLARMIYMNQLENKEYKILKDTLVETINKALNHVQYQNLTSTEDINEMNSRLTQNKNFIENQLNELKTTGEIGIYDYSTDITCKNGTVINDIPQTGSGKICELDYETNNYIKTDYNSIKLFEVKPDIGFVNIAAESLLILLPEYTINLYENLQSSKKDNNILIGKTLTELDYLSKIVIEWQVIQAPISNLSNDNQSLLYKNSKKVSANLEDFNNNYQAPTEEEINNTQLKDNCIRFFDEIRKKGYSQNQGLDLTIKSSFTEQILFLPKSFQNICKEIDKTEKELAINMLKRTEIEKNPFVAISNKIYLNLFVKCQNETFSDSINRPCIDNYTKEIKENLVVELNKQ